MDDIRNKRFSFAVLVTILVSMAFMCLSNVYLQLIFRFEVIFALVAPLCQIYLIFDIRSKTSAVKKNELVVTIPASMAIMCLTNVCLQLIFRFEVILALVTLWTFDIKSKKSELVVTIPVSVAINGLTNVCLQLIFRFAVILALVTLWIFDASLRWKSVSLWWPFQWAWPSNFLNCWDRSCHTHGSKETLVQFEIFFLLYNLITLLLFHICVATVRPNANIKVHSL